MRASTLPAGPIVAFFRPSICSRCAYRLIYAHRVTLRRNLTSSIRHNQTAPAIGRTYFFDNDRAVTDEESLSNVRKRGKVGARSARIPPGRHASKDEQSRTSSCHDGTSQPPLARRDSGERDDHSFVSHTLAPLPLDASSALSSLATSAPPMSWRRRSLAFLSLTKPRLASLIVLTTTASYSLYPVPPLLSASATQAPSLSTLTLAFLTTGTFATVASANTLNMLFEPTHDAKMSRTRNRPIVRGLVSRKGALIFAILTGVTGIGILWTGVNSTTAALGGFNIILYAFVYTPLKRLSVLNTWAGAVVGAIPPLMGWSAAGGHYLTTTPSLGSTSTIQAFKDEATDLLFTPNATGGWLLAALLFSWQFPHFNALSYPIRHEYANAGYRMAASFYPKLNARVALRYSVAMFPICAGLTYYGITDKGFLVTSTAANAWMLREALRFWRTGGGETPQAAKAARGLFWASVWHLPLVLTFAMAQKQGLWRGMWGRLMEEEHDEEMEEL
ncbi:hypothetical protein KVT40_006703 [Elsinoe batatas]|uniref:Protoheme IX farnesyltransferase, mitochondrial n=1 Tax=Elsinoe batatas TaxID=2601811 RepID=A0A8K0KX43_9PEZI|nr:hypothetical protein KVT40_006703 [Elsinoe batatas]